MIIIRKTVCSIVLFAALLLLCGCDSEEPLYQKVVSNTYMDQGQEFQMEQLGLWQLEDSAAVREALSRLSNTNGNISAKSGFPDIYGFNVGTAKIKAITREGVRSYTFHVPNGNRSVVFE